MGSYLSIHNDTDKTVFVNIGPDKAAIKIAGWITGSIAMLTFVHWSVNASQKGAAGAMMVAKRLNDSGMVELAPGDLISNYRCDFSLKK